MVWELYFDCITTQAAVPPQGENPEKLAINAATNATFKISDTNLYVPVVTLSNQDNNQLLQ